MSIRPLALATLAFAVLACSSAPPPEVAVLSAGPDARSFPLVQYGTGFFGGTKSVGEGQLEIGSDGLVWTSTRDRDRNLALRPEVISRIWLTCASRAGDNLCLDLGVETLTGNEYHFRERNWEGGANSAILDAFGYAKSIYPRVRFDERAVEDFR